jgi:hypothetical protein
MEKKMNKKIVTLLTLSLLIRCLNAAESYDSDYSSDFHAAEDAAAYPKCVTFDQQLFTLSAEKFAQYINVAQEPDKFKRDISLCQFFASIQKDHPSQIEKTTTLLQSQIKDLEKKIYYEFFKEAKTKNMSNPQAHQYAQEKVAQDEYYQLKSWKALLKKMLQEDTASSED